MDRLFARGCSEDLGVEVARLLGTACELVEEDVFPDGEIRLRLAADVDGCDVVVIHSLVASPQGAGTTGSSVHDELCSLLLLLGTLRDAGAASVTVVAPYLCYARQDRRVRPREAVSSRYVAELLQAVGADRVMTVDVHNPAAFEGAYPRPVNISSMDLLTGVVGPLLDGRPPVVVAPDSGAVKRAEQAKLALEATCRRPVDDAFIEKHRHDHVTSDHAVVGTVDGMVAVIVDDLVATGTTLVQAAQACREQGAAGVVAAATHGLFTGDAADVLSDPALDHLVVTDTIAPFRLEGHAVADKIEVVSAAPLVAAALAPARNGASCP